VGMSFEFIAAELEGQDGMCGSINAILLAVFTV